MTLAVSSIGGVRGGGGGGEGGGGRELGVIASRKEGCLLCVCVLLGSLVSCL